MVGAGEYMDELGLYLLRCEGTFARYLLSYGPLAHRSNQDF
jgi:hypothetical protein